MEIILQGRWPTIQSTAAALIATILSLHPAIGQTSRLTMQGQAENSSKAPIRDSLGRACLDVEAAARAQAINPAMIDHLVSVKNNCAMLIKLKVCYLNADRCNDVDLPAYKRIDTTLGSMKGISFFKYTITRR